MWPFGRNDRPQLVGKDSDDQYILRRIDELWERIYGLEHQLGLKPTFNGTHYEPAKKEG